MDRSAARDGRKVADSRHHRPPLRSRYSARRTVPPGRSPRRLLGIAVALALLMLSSSLLIMQGAFLTEEWIGEGRSETATTDWNYETDFKFAYGDFNCMLASSGDKVMVIGYTGPGGDIVIPSVANGVPVTDIGHSAFKDHADIYSVKIPGSVIVIRNEAFASCSALTYVYIGSGATIFEEHVFDRCTALRTVVITSDAPFFALDDDVLQYYGLVFNQCFSLTKIIFTGDAPRELSTGEPEYHYYWYSQCPPGMTAYYRQGAAGFTSPTWDGLRSEALPSTPIAPERVTASAVNDKVTLSWLAPGYSGSSPIDYYTVYYDDVPAGTFTSTSGTITVPERFRSYNITVVAHNAAGDGWRSDPVTVRPAEFTLDIESDDPPIVINGNGDLADYIAGQASSGLAWGQGTENDPYVISGMNISAAAGPALSISNVDAHLIVNGSVFRGSTASYAVSLTSCRNIVIQGCELLSDRLGIFMEDSADITVRNCSGDVKGPNIEIFGDRLGPTGETALRAQGCTRISVEGLWHYGLLYLSGSTHCTVSSYYGILRIEGGGHHTITDFTGREAGSNVSGSDWNAVSGPGLINFYGANNNTLSGTYYPCSWLAAMDGKAITVTGDDNKVRNVTGQVNIDGRRNTVSDSYVSVYLKGGSSNVVRDNTVQAGDYIWAYGVNYAWESYWNCIWVLYGDSSNYQASSDSSSRPRYGVWGNNDGAIISGNTFVHDYLTPTDQSFPNYVHSPVSLGVGMNGTGNLVQDNDFLGLTVGISSAGTGDTISDNVFEGCGHGILASGMSRVSIHDNLFSNCTYGIRFDISYDIRKSWDYKIDGGHNVIIRDNRLTDVEHAMHFVEAATVTVLDNEIINSSRGIYVAQCTGFLFRENSLTDSFGGLFLNRSTHITVRANAFLNSSVMLDGDRAVFFNSHDITADNTVDGRPVYYLNESYAYSHLGEDIMSSAGQIILVGSGLIIDGLHMSGGDRWFQLLLGFAPHCTLINSSLDGAYYGLRAVGVVDLTVRNVSLSGNAVACSLVSVSGSSFADLRSLDSGTGVAARGCQGLSFDKIAVRGGALGVYLNGSNGVSFRDGTFLDNAADIRASLSDGLLISGCRFVNGTEMINMSSCSDGIVEGCDLSGRGGIGIYLSMSSSYSSENNVIKNNNISGCSEAIFFYYISPSRKNIIRDNLLQDNTMGIHLWSVSNVDVVGNTVRNGYQAITIAVTSYYTVDSNFIEMAEKGIVIGNSPTGRTVVNNVLHNVTASPVVHVTTPSKPVEYTTLSDYEMKWRFDGINMLLSGSTLSAYEVRLDQEGTEGAWGSASSSTSNRFTLKYENNTAHVRVRDQGNNIYWTSVDIICQAKPPPAVITFPRDGQWLNYTTVEVKWTSTAGLLLDRFEVSTGGPPIYVGTNTTCYVHLSGEGQYTVYVRTWNKAGGSSVSEVTFTIDLTKPTVSITSPKNEDTVVGATVTIVAKATDNSGVIDHYERSVDGGAWTRVAGSVALATFDAGLTSDGTHTVAVRAYDKAGNFGQAEVTFTADLPPKLTIEWPQGWSNTTDVDFRWSTTADDITYYQVSQYGTPGTWVTVGKDTTYRLLSYAGEGTWTAYLRAYDLGGNVAYQNATFIIDTTRPDIEILAPDGGDLLNNRNVPVQWSSTSSDVARYEVSVNGVVVYNGPSTSTTVTAPDGVVSITVTAIDRAGNRNSASVVITVDATPPSLNFVFPRNNEHINVTDVNVTWTADDPASGVDYCEISTDGVTWFPTEGGLFHHLSFTEGTHTVYLRATDRAGNRCDPVKSTFIVDITPPTISITSPAEGAFLNSSSVTVAWTSDATSFEITAGTVWRTVTGGAFSYRYNDLSDGKYVIKVRARDQAGNEVVATLNITVDTKAPQVSINYPLPNGFVPATFWAVWNGTDDGTSSSGIYGYRYRVDDGEYIFTAEKGAWLTVDPGPGLHRLYVRAYDRANNSSPEAVVVFYVDNVPPQLQILSPQDGAAVPSYRLIVSWNATDDSGMAYYEISVSPGIWTRVDANSTEVQLLSVANIITVRAYDRAGNMAEASISVTVDTVKPDIVILYPQNGTPIGVDTPEIRWRSAADDIDYYEVSFDRKSWERVDGDRYSRGLGQGTYTVWVRAYDRAGNVNETSSTFLVDTVAPDLVLLQPTKNLFPFVAVTVEWTSQAPDLDRYEMYVNGERWELEGAKTNRTVLNLNAGTYVIEVRAYDPAGNMRLVTITIVIDAPPVLTITAPLNNSYLNTASAMLTWECQDDNIAWFEVFDGGEWRDIGTTRFYSLPLSEGSNVLRVRAHDAAGNVVEANVTVTRDTVLPYVVSRLPVGSSVAPGAIVDVTFSEEMKSVDITIRGLTGTGQLMVDRATFTPSRYLAKATVYTVTIEGEDLAGNKLAPVTWSFTVAGTVTVTGTVVDRHGDPVPGVAVSIGGVTALTDRDGVYRLEIAPGSVTVEASLDGEGASASLEAFGEAVTAPPITLDMDQGSDASMYWIIIAAAVAAVSATVILWMRRKR